MLGAQPWPFTTGAPGEQVDEPLVPAAGPLRPDELKQYDHVREAQDRINMLDKAISTLQRMRRSRDAVAQQLIDDAVARAYEYRQTLQDVLNTR